jgi:putative DNA primase/helicase
VSAVTKRTACPRCNRNKRDTALAITTDDRGTVAYCHRCYYTEANNLEVRSSMPRHTTASPQPLDWSTRAASIWHLTQNLRGTLGETYSQSRGCAIPPSDSHLRFLPSDGNYPPSLVGCITDVVTGKPISLHFTRLSPDGKSKAGTDRDKLLLAGHRKKSGVIRLWPNDCVTHGLAIAEGIETALAAAHLFTPVWATVDCSNMAAFPVLDGVEALTIFADHDAAGIAAARECAKRWRLAGKEVRLRMPAMKGLDVNDLARACA